MRFLTSVDPNVILQGASLWKYLITITYIDYVSPLYGSSCVSSDCYTEKMFDHIPRIDEVSPQYGL